MMKIGDDCCLWRLGRYLINLNLFETDETDEISIRIQRWSTYLYIVVLFFAMYILLFQNVFEVESQMIEVRNPSLDSYLKLRSLHTDINCPCSQISTLYGSFVILAPIYHPICSSQFISQTWIEILVDNKTTFRFVGDFRATASTQFQILRELCYFSQLVLNNYIEAFYDREYISGALLNEYQWHIEIKAAIDAFLDDSLTNVAHRISFLRSFVTFNLLVSGIQTPMSLILQQENNVAILGLKLNLYHPSEDDSYCACDNGDGCSLLSGFYNVDMFNNNADVKYDTLESELSYVLKNWFAGCWALESLLISSFNDSFLTNQWELNLIARYFGWSSASMLPSVLNQTESNKINITGGTFNDLLQNLFIENVVTDFNYSIYFEQCQAQSCFYSTRKNAGSLYILTSLLSLYGGLSVVLRFLIPWLVAFLVRRFRRRTEVPDNIESATVTIANRWWQRVKAMLERLRNSLVNINLFRSSLRRQPSDIKEQRWTSRIYILCLLFGVAILTCYVMLRVQKKSIQVKNPTHASILYLQSQKELNSSLQCPCTEIQAPYGQFVELQPFYHQICSSDFVSQEWLYNMRALLQVNADLKLDKLDFRHSYQSFYLLTSLCDLVNKTTISSLQVFERTQLVTSQLLSVDLFENQMFSVIQNLQSEMASTFLRFFQLTRQITYANQYFNGGNVGSFDFTYHNTTFSIYNYSSGSGNLTNSCSCANDINCKSQLGLYDTVYISSPKELVPGLYRACFSLESLLQSTLECFYDDQDCLTNITDFYNQAWFPANFSRLKSSLTSRFTTHSTISSLLSELFIEYWNQSLNYSSYFALCKPVSCSYEIFRKNNLMETITIILGLIGGLAVSLKILVPFVVTLFVGFIGRLQQQRTISEARSVVVRLTTFAARIMNWLKQINVFDNPNKTTGNHVHEQRRATHVYFLLLTVTLIILMMYNSLTYFTDSFTVNNPSLEQYQQLQQSYGVDIVNCPCSQVSITYSTFIDFECSFHQVCTSQFISDSYLQQLFDIYSRLDKYYATTNAFTLKGTIFAHFQALQILCNLATDAFKDAHDQYLTSSVIYASMIDYNLFEKQMNMSLTRFNSTLPDEFLSNLHFVRGVMQGNAFVSLYSTNWYPVTHDWVSDALVYMQPQYYGNCSCLTSSSCTQQSSPFIQGYLVGCTPFESILRSSIECLYEQSCVDLLSIYLNMSLPNSSAPLNKSETRFSSNDTVDSIVQQMFIETCSSNVSYSQFFEQCHPVSCSITPRKRNSLIIVATTLFSLYGGLTIILKLIVPFVVFSIYKLIRRRNRIQPGTVQLNQLST